MTTKIAYISDIHHESSDPKVGDKLTQALQTIKPDLLIAGGDFVNNPWKLDAGRNWLWTLCGKCGIDPACQLYVVPGNHDYRLVGNFGFSPLGSLLFNRQFKNVWKKGIVLDREHNITFVSFDSNPVMFGLARGRISYWQLRKLKKQFRRFDSDSRAFIAGSTKIAILHHHPFPVPFEGSNFFLVLSNTQPLFKYLAEFGVDLVFHGHKHRATHTRLSLGTSTGADRFIEILGAGTAAKSGTDHDPRGHNFNLITVEDRGLIYAQQFFARQPGEAFAELASAAVPAQTFDRAYKRTLERKKYKHGRVDWQMIMDFEGDRYNEISYSGVAAAAGATLSDITPPSYTLETGHLSRVRLNPEKTSTTVRLVPVKEERREAVFQFVFTENPTDAEPARFSVTGFDFNAVPFDETEFDQKFPGRSKQNGYVDYEEKEIDEAVENFSWTVAFPPDFVLSSPPKFEVFDCHGKRRHAWLTAVLQPCFSFAERPKTKTAFLSIQKPPAHYRYRISWVLSNSRKLESPEEAGYRLILGPFQQRLLKLRAGFAPGSPPQGQMAELVQMLQAFNLMVNAKLKEKNPNLPEINFDVSLSVCDYADSPPKLRVVAGTPSCISDANQWNFELEIGDGNAGRAYKKTFIRFHDSAKVGWDKKEAYIRIPGSPQHTFLYSIPLKRPKSENIVYCVLNLGTFGANEGNLLSGLNDEEGNKWLLEVAHAFVLTGLLKMFNIVI
jgi:predicted phosphodiesterase